MIILSSVPVNIKDETWVKTDSFDGDSLLLNASSSAIITTPHPRLYSNKIGYGKLDAYRAVVNAKNWNPLGPQVSLKSPFTMEDKLLNSDATTVSIFSVTFPQLDVDHVALGRLEHVTLMLWLESPSRGSISVVLVSPRGIPCILAPKRPNDHSTAGFKNWTLMTVQFWEERGRGVGVWTMRLAGQGKLIGWQVSLFGEQKRLSDSNPDVNSSNPSPSRTLLTPTITPSPISTLTSSNLFNTGSRSNSLAVTIICTFVVVSLVVMLLVQYRRYWIPTRFYRYDRPSRRRHYNPLEDDTARIESVFEME